MYKSSNAVVPTSHASTRRPAPRPQCRRPSRASPARAWCAAPCTRSRARSSCSPGTKTSGHTRRQTSKCSKTQMTRPGACWGPHDSVPSCRPWPQPAVVRLWGSQPSAAPAPIPRPLPLYASASPAPTLLLRARRECSPCLLPSIGTDTLAAWANPARPNKSNRGGRHTSAFFPDRAPFEESMLPHVGWG